MQTLTSIGVTTMMWQDDFLIWDPEDYDNITVVYIPGDMIWKPDIMISNLGGNGEAGKSLSNVAKVNYNGKV